MQSRTFERATHTLYLHSFSQLFAHIFYHIHIHTHTDKQPAYIVYKPLKACASKMLYTSSSVYTNILHTHHPIFPLFFVSPCLLLMVLFSFCFSFVCYANLILTLCPYTTTFYPCYERLDRYYNIPLVIMTIPPHTLYIYIHTHIHHSSSINHP